MAKTREIYSIALATCDRTNLTKSTVCLLHKKSDLRYETNLRTIEKDVKKSSQCKKTIEGVKQRLKYESMED